MENSFPIEQGLAFEFTDKPVTPWGGLRLMQEMLLRMDFRGALKASGLPEPGSNRGYDPVAMMEAFIVCVWIGGVRFSHTSLVRYDAALRDIFGWKRVASVSTFTRWFRKFERQDVDRVFGSLGRWFWEQLSPRTITIDLDSSAVPRFGEQEGAVIGYNNHERGKAGHRPLFAFVSDWRMVLHAWLRPGNTADCNGAKEFTLEALDLLGSRHRVGLIRADAGFYDGSFLDLLESRSISYVVSARLTAPLRDATARAKQWLSIEPGLEVTEFVYQGQRWLKPRRLVVVRQELKHKPDANGRELIELPGYKFSAFVTTLDLAPAEVWRIYKGRCDSENRIAELKGDFGLNGFCLDPFYATEAAFRTVMVAYNLMSLFRQALLQAPKSRAVVDDAIPMLCIRSLDRANRSQEGPSDQLGCQKTSLVRRVVRKNRRLSVSVASPGLSSNAKSGLKATSRSRLGCKGEVPHLQRHSKSGNSKSILGTEKKRWARF